MKRIILFIFLGFSAVQLQAQDPYFFGDNSSFDPKVPTPEEFFGFTPGSSLVRYDKVVEYFRALAASSDRATLEVFGYTPQYREQVKLIVTSPQNQSRLEDIRQSHLRLVDPGATVDYAEEKVVVELAYNVHGGEIAGTDASVLTAYYLVATEDPDMLERLEEAVVLIEPAQNPDGRERAVNFINGFQSEPTVTDPADAGHSGGWTPHRGNQYWNDLNRDWLALAQVESRNRVAYYHKWYPNVYLDFHEMGSASTYYFEPSPLSTWNRILPQSNYEVLTAILADHFAAALDNIGSLYFTKESFTNLSPIYGSTYPDYQGGAGITLEIGSTSGVAVETAAGVRTFAKNLRDNLSTGIAGVIAATDAKETFLKEQKTFFESAIRQADELPYKSIVFGDSADHSLNRMFLDHLLRHQIEVYTLPESVSVDGKSYQKEHAYVVPLKQAQFRVLQSVFEENETNAYDEGTTFYDVSGWSTAVGYGIPFGKSAAALPLGQRVHEVPELPQPAVAEARVAYALDFQDLLAPKALYILLEKGLVPRVAHRSFTSLTDQGTHAFATGSLIVPVAYQSQSPEEVRQILQEAAHRTGLTVYAINSGFSVEGVDLGSNNIGVVKKPEIALVSGGNWTAFGEIWQLLNETYGIPVTRLRADALQRVDLSRYSAIILTGGGYSRAFAEELNRWVGNGGTLISLSGANTWVYRQLFPDTTGKDGEGGADNALQAAGATGRNNPARLNGVVVNAKLDLSSPLAYGLRDSIRYAMKTSINGLDESRVDRVILQSGDELVSGYATEDQLSKLDGNILVGATGKGRGEVVFFAESPVFRNYWYGSGRLLANALFFGAGNRSRR